MTIIPRVPSPIKHDLSKELVALAISSCENIKRSLQLKGFLASSSNAFLRPMTAVTIHKSA
jgi:hypothetical protein